MKPANIFINLAIGAISTISLAQTSRFKAFVLTEEGGQHGPFVMAPLDWMGKLSAEYNFSCDVIHTADSITDDFLYQYDVFIQLNYPPYSWPDEAMDAFKKYIETGKGGGWVGFHHTTLLGEFDGYPIWQ